MHNHNDAHNHHHGKNSSLRALIFAIIFTFAFAIVEAIGGWFANSLALMGDAGHMGSDALALCIAAFAAWVAQKPPSKKHTFGLGRAEVIAAWISSMLMLLISVAVIVEAIARIHKPEHVHGATVVLIAFVGLLVNLLVAWVLARGERTINLRAALLHVIGDMLGSFAALVSGAVIYYTGWMPIDPILSIVIGILILISSLRLLRESMLILMEGKPKFIDFSTVKESMPAVEGVDAVHDLHIWTLSSGRIALSAHVHIDNFVHWPSILPKLKTVLRDMGVNHITLQPESDDMDCVDCNGN